MTGRVSEGASNPITVEFLDSGSAAVPASVQYQITCLTNDAVVHDWESVSPGSTVTIVATPDDNQIINDRNAREKKQLVVKAVTEEGLTMVGHHEWMVDNLRGVR